MNTAGLSLDQAPPLRVPLAFYTLIPVFLALGGGLLAHDGVALLVTGWAPPTMALVHVFTLGVLGAAMWGSMYPLVPVVAGARVPGLALAPAVAAALGLGASALVAGLRFGSPVALFMGGALLALALVAFLGPVGWALGRAPARGATVLGLRLAVLCLAALGGLGLRLALGHTRTEAWPMPDARADLLLVHVGLGLFGWLGGLIAAVAGQVMPMFFLARGPGPAVATGLALAHALPPLAAAVGLGLGWPAPWLLVLIGMAAVAAFGVQPVLVLVALARRKRRRPEASLRFFVVSALAAPLALAAGVALARTDYPPAGPLLGWLALAGWALSLVLGMLSRIVPFLLWFHGVSQAGEGRGPVPPMKRLWLETEVAGLWWLHSAVLLCGLAAITLTNDLLARATGGLLFGEGVGLALSLRRAVVRARGPG
jgi:hypothetical protein